MAIEFKNLKAAIKEVWIRSLCEIPPDILAALNHALDQETDPRARTHLEIMIKNALLARENRAVICQDTGIPTFFVRTPLDFPCSVPFRPAFEEALRELTLGEFPMRPMVVHPVTRADRCDNTGANVPLISVEVDQDLDYMEIKAVPKGAGSGIWGTLQFFSPSVGIDGIKKFVVDSVLRAGTNPCPPLIVGVGLGGTLEEVARLATAASSRPIDRRHPEPELAQLEEDLFTALNLSEIGVMGMGGQNTVLAVNIEYSGTHKPWLPVAVNVNCWPGRKATCRIYRDGRTEQL